MPSEYEISQIFEIKKWESEAPSVLSRALDSVTLPFSWLINKVIPESAIEGVLDFSSSAAEWLTDTKDILRDSGMSSIDDLKSYDLKKSDDLANEVHNWAIAFASAEGGTTGATGILGMAVDIPAIIVLALRTIHKIGICYGFEVKTKEDKDFVLFILSASGANSVEEKVAALTTLRAIQNTIAKQTWNKIAENAAKNSFGRDALIISIKNLAKQLGINITKRKALQAIPVVGAVVGASVNAWYIKEVGWAARREFQKRWLLENNKIRFKPEFK